MEPVILTVGLVTVVVGAILLGWAVFWDRSRGRRRCPTCWYDMGGLVNAACETTAAVGLAANAHRDSISIVRCPECGGEIVREGQMFRTRRRWGWALVGLMLVGLPIGAVVVVTTGDRWVQYAPTSALVLTVDPRELVPSYMFSREQYRDHWQQRQWRGFKPPQQGARAKELIARIAAGGLASWQSQVLFDRVFAAAPMFGEPIISSRTIWPVDVPFVVGVNAPHSTLLFGNNWSCDLRVRLLTTPTGEPGPWSAREDQFFFETASLGMLSPDARSIEVEVELQQEGKRLWRGHHTLPTRVVSSVKDALQPFQDSQVDTQVASWISPSAWLQSRTNMLSLQCSDENREQMFGRYVAMGFRMQALCNGKAVGEGPLVLTPPVAGGCFGSVHFEMLAVAKGLSPTGPDVRWELELVSDAELALRDFDQRSMGGRIKYRGPGDWKEPTEFWVGSLRLPLDVHLASDP